MSALEQAVLSRAEARSLTDEVKGDAERLWRKLVELYEGGAHTALGHKSWKAYWEAEFDGDWSRGYQLVQAGQIANALENFPTKPKNDSQARTLAPFIEEPAKLREVWAEVIEQHPEPTAAQVREVVKQHTALKSAPTRKTELPRVVTVLKELYAAVQSTPIEEVIAWEGNARKLAAEWATVQSYITDLFAAANVAVPEVVKGVVDG